jgi:hypothetical protein
VVAGGGLGVVAAGAVVAGGGACGAPVTVGITAAGKFVRAGATKVALVNSKSVNINTSLLDRREAI